jgi:hypothetical protein
MDQLNFKYDLARREPQRLMNRNKYRAMGTARGRSSSLVQYCGS